LLRGGGKEGSGVPRDRNCKRKRSCTEKRENFAIKVATKKKRRQGVCRKKNGSPKKK